MEYPLFLYHADRSSCMKCDGTCVFFSPGSLSKLLMDVSPFLFHPTPKYHSFWGENNGNAKCTTWCKSLEKEIDPARSVNSLDFMQTGLIRRSGTTSDLEIVFLIHKSPRIVFFLCIM